MSGPVPAEKLVHSHLARWGIYGPNGAGKTTLLSSIPRDIATIVVSADQENTDPFIGHPHILVWKVETWKELAAVLTALRKGLFLPDGHTPDPDVLSGKRRFFRAVAFDTWTRMQALAVNMLVGYDMIQPGQEVEFIERAPKLPKGYEQWQQAGALLVEWMRYFERLPIHNVYLFQEMTRDPKFAGDPIKTGPALTPSALVGAKDTLKILGRLYVEAEEEAGGLLIEPSHKINLSVTEQRVLFIGQDERYIAKGPTHLLGRGVIDPTWEKLAVSLAPAPVPSPVGPVLSAALSEE